MDDFDTMIQQYEQEQQEDLQKYLASIEQGEKTAENYYNVMLCYDGMNISKKYDAEVQKYATIAKQAAKDDINNHNNPAKAYSILALIYQQEKNFKDAISNINMAIELEPDNADYYITRGDIYLHDNRQKIADLNFAKAIELNPAVAENIKNTKDIYKIIGKTNTSGITIYAITMFVLISIMFFAIFSMMN